MSIQFGTARFFQRSGEMMARQQARADRLNTEIATGVRVSSPSVDPVAAARAQGLTRLAADEKQYLANAKLAGSLLDQADSALATMETNIQRARELAIRGASETTTPADRKAIATELRAIVDDLFAIANLNDARGQPLFGGSSAGPAYTRAADGTIGYAGTGDPTPIPIGDGVSVIATDSGQRLFGNIDSDANGDPRDMFAMLSGLADTLADATLTTADRRAATDKGLAAMGTVTDRLAGARASVGARGARLDVEQARLEDFSAERLSEAKLLTGTNYDQAILDLKETMFVLEATQKSIAQVTQLSLFDLIR